MTREEELEAIERAIAAGKLHRVPYPTGIPEPFDTMNRKSRPKRRIAVSAAKPFAFRREEAYRKLGLV